MNVIDLQQKISTLKKEIRQIEYNFGGSAENAGIQEKRGRKVLEAGTPKGRGTGASRQRDAYVLYWNLRGQLEEYEVIYQQKLWQKPVQPVITSVVMEDTPSAMWVRIMSSSGKKYDFNVSGNGKPLEQSARDYFWARAQRLLEQAQANPFTFFS